VRKRNKVQSIKQGDSIFPIEFRALRGIIAANQARHQTPDSPAVLAGAGGGAGELSVRRSIKMVFWIGY